MSKEKIAIVGAGALGSYLADTLSKRAEILLLGRNLAELSSFKAKFIFICVKAHHLDDLMKTLTPHLSNSSILVLCCNGLGMYFQLATALKVKCPILRLLPNIGLRKLSDGKIIVSGEPLSYLASTAQDKSDRDGLEAILRESGWRLQVEKDIATAEWKKALTNIIVNSLASICDAPNGIILDSLELKELAGKVLAEIRAVALADGFDLSSPTDKDIFAGIKNHAQNICSTLVDLRAGKKTEIDCILGRFLRLARDYGIATPISETLYLLLKALENKVVA